jgi:hypothetical protein
MERSAWSSSSAAMRRPSCTRSGLTPAWVIQRVRYWVSTLERYSASTRWSHSRRTASEAGGSCGEVFMGPLEGERTNGRLATGGRSGVAGGWPHPFPGLRVELLSRIGGAVSRAGGGRYVGHARRGREVRGARPWGTRAGGGRYVGHARRGREVRGARAPGACRVRASAHRLSFWRPCRGLSMRALGRGWRAGRQGRSADVLVQSRRAPQSCAPTSAGNKVDQAPTGAHRSVAGGRRRGRDKPPTHGSYVHPVNLPDGSLRHERSTGKGGFSLRRRRCRCRRHPRADRRRAARCRRRRRAARRRRGAAAAGCTSRG